MKKTGTKEKGKRKRKMIFCPYDNTYKPVYRLGASRRKVKKMVHASLAGSEGRIPWNVDAILDCMSYLASLRRRAVAEGWEDELDPGAAAVQYLKEKYGPRKMVLWAPRMLAINEFLFNNLEQLKADGFVEETESHQLAVEESLLKALAKMDYAGGKGQFSYDRVCAYAKRVMAAN